MPLAVIISLPLGVIGAYFGQMIAGLENNIYFQIALIMLVGLLAKNAILIDGIVAMCPNSTDIIIQFDIFIHIKNN